MTISYLKSYCLFSFTDKETIDLPKQIRAVIEKEKVPIKISTYTALKQFLFRS